MAFALSKILVLALFSLLLKSSITVLARDLVGSGSLSEMKELVSFKVHGYVYCKSCNYKLGNDSLLDSTPLSGATVRLQCNGNKNHLIKDATTDKNGYFALVSEKQLSKSEYEECKVLLVSSPNENCNVQTDLNSGVDGAFLKFSRKVPLTQNSTSNIELFEVGPFAFESPRPQESCDTVAALKIVSRDSCDVNCLSCEGGCCRCSFDDYGYCLLCA